MISLVRRAFLPPRGAPEGIVDINEGEIFLNIDRELEFHRTPTSSIRVRIPVEWNGVIFVCFDSAKRPRTLSDDGFGEKFLLSKNYGVCSFKCTLNDWYKWVDQEILVEIRRKMDSIGCKEIVGYGNSMGGYAAIKFSKALGMSRTISFSPQAVLDHPQDPRWKNAIENFGAIPKIEASDLSADCSYEIYYDSQHKRDRLQCNFLRKAGVKEDSFIGVPYTGHLTVTAFSEAGLLKRAIGRAISRVEWRGAKAMSPTYLRMLSAQASTRKKRQLAADLAARALALNTDEARSLDRNANVLHRLGRSHHAQALSAAEKAVSLDPENPVYAFTLALICSVKDRKRAMAIARKSLAAPRIPLSYRRKFERLIERLSERD